MKNVCSMFSLKAVIYTLINIQNSLLQKGLMKSHFVIKSTLNTKAKLFFVLEIYFYL